MHFRRLASLLPATATATATAALTLTLQPPAYAADTPPSPLTRSGYTLDFS